MSEANQQKRLVSRHLATAKETLDATKHGTGSGTLACRLWHELRALVDVLEKANTKAEG